MLVANRCFSMKPGTCMCLLSKLLCVNCNDKCPKTSAFPSESTRNSDGYEANSFRKQMELSMHIGIGSKEKNSNLM